MFRTSRIACRTIRRLLLAAFAATGLAATGCVGVSRQMTEAYEAIFQRQREKRELAEIRHETRDELSEQRREAMREQADYEIEQARLDAEQKKLENAFCVSKREQLQEQVKSQLRDKIQSKIAFDVTHALDVGELEVDVEKLQKILKQREQLKEQPREPFQEGPSQKGCPCMQKNCECGGPKWACRKCCHKKCEPDCGGPEAYRRALREPLKEPLRPTEIPLKLPVKLHFGMQNPEVEETKVRKEPLREPMREPMREPFKEQPSQKGPPSQKPDPFQKDNPFQNDEPAGQTQEPAPVVTDFDIPPEPRSAGIPSLPVPEPDVR